VFESVEVTHERTARHNSSPAEVASRLQGRRVTGVERHGKFLRISLDDGQTMVAHLGMSGRWAVDGEDGALHTHFVGRMDSGTVVRFIDPRTFGFVAVYDEDEILGSGLSRLGPDAWTDPPQIGELGERLAGRTAPIKALLLNQRPISGLGNIYADETLHLAGIHPLTPGGALDPEDLGRLIEAVRIVLETAISRGGTTLSDAAYLLPDGRAGANMADLVVYGRQDEPCTTCGTPIERLVVRGRSSHFCPNCQMLR